MVIRFQRSMVSEFVNHAGIGESKNGANGTQKKLDRSGLNRNELGDKSKPNLITYLSNNLKVCYQTQKVSQSYALLSTPNCHFDLWPRGKSR